MPLLDILRAPWKHSDPKKRAEAVRLLESDRRDIFVSLATSDPDAGVRLAAVKRLTEEADLRKALERSDEGPARDALREKLSRIVADRAAVERDVDALKAIAWLEELDALGAPEKIFAELSLKAPSPFVRKNSLGRLVHASSFLAVAVRDGDDAIALEACFRLEKESHLDSVAREAKSAAVRKSARERLRALEKAKGPDEAAQHKAKLGILLTTVERAAARAADHAAGFDWTTAREQVEDAVETFEAMTASGFRASAAERAHFAANVAAFRERHAVHVEIEEARRERDEEEARVRAIREEVCEALEGLFANPNPADASAVEELETRFRAPGPADKDDPSVERFRIARERLRDKLRRQHAHVDAAEAKKRHEAEDGRARADEKNQVAAKAAAEEQDAKRREERARRDEERKAARLEAAAALEAFAAEMEGIVDRADFKGAEKRLRELRERGDAAAAFLGRGAEHADIIGRFHAAAGRLRETLDWNQWAHKKHKEEMDQAREANIAAKTSLCDAAEKLGELPDDDARYTRILELQTQWKATGFVPREQGDALWARFRAPIDAYFAGRRERSAAALEDDEGVSIREDICTEAEGLATLDRRDAAEKVRTLQAEWHAAPPVPRHIEQKLWARFRKACDKAFAP
jgi:hypothetical protein